MYRANRLFPAIACLAIVLHFYKLILANAVDIPQGDDLYCLLPFTQKFTEASGWQQRLQLLTEQWVEHRILYSRLTALISYWVTGKVNFVWIILIGNATLLGFAAIFWRVIKPLVPSNYYLIPIILILFSPVMYEASVWAGAATVYMPVCFMGLLTVYLLSERGRARYILALLVAGFATFSFGNGMFSFVAGMLVLCMQQRFRHAVLWFFCGAGSVFLYFRNFEMHSGTQAFGVGRHFEAPEYLFYNFLAFLSGIFEFVENVNAPVEPGNYPAIAVGVLITIAACWGGYRAILIITDKSISDAEKKRWQLWLGMAAFLGITAMAMSYSRTAGVGMNTVSSRYKIYPMVAVIMLYWLFLMHFRRKKAVLFAFGPMSLALLGMHYFSYYEKLLNQKSYVLSGLFNYNINHQWAIYRHTDYYERASQAISDAIKASAHPVYHFKTIFPELTFAALENAETLLDVQITEDTIPLVKSGKRLTIQSNSYPALIGNFEGIYLVAYNQKSRLLFVAEPVRNGRLNMVRQREYFKNGFYFDQYFGQILEAGVDYKLAIFCPGQNQCIRKLRYKIRG